MARQAEIVPSGHGSQTRRLLFRPRPRQCEQQVANLGQHSCPVVKGEPFPFPRASCQSPAPICGVTRCFHADRGRVAPSV